MREPSHNAGGLVRFSADPPMRTVLSPTNAYSEDSLIQCECCDSENPKLAWVRGLPLTQEDLYLLESPDAGILGVTNCSFALISAIINKAIKQIDNDFS